MSVVVTTDHAFSTWKQVCAETDEYRRNDQNCHLPNLRIVSFFAIEYCRTKVDQPSSSELVESLASFMLERPISPGERICQNKESALPLSRVSPGLGARSARGTDIPGVSRPVTAALRVGGFLSAFGD